MTTITNANAPADSVETAQDDAAERIATLRGQIDALDAAIINLVAERVQVSKLIQTTRINDGGTRVEISRERQILDAYRAALGREGQHLADAILQVSRGQR